LHFAFQREPRVESKNRPKASAVFWSTEDERGRELVSIAANTLKEVFSEKSETVFYLKFNDHHACSFVREKIIWPLNTDETQNNITVIRLEGTQTLLITIFGEGQSVDALQTILLAKPQNVSSAMIGNTPSNIASINALGTNKLLYRISLNPQEEIHVAGHKEDLDTLLTSIGALAPPVTKKVTQFYNFSPKAKILAYRETLGFPTSNDCVIGCDMNMATLRIKGSREAVSEYSKLVDEDLKNLQFTHKEINLSWTDIQDMGQRIGICVDNAATNFNVREALKDFLTPKFEVALKNYVQSKFGSLSAVEMRGPTFIVSAWDSASDTFETKKADLEDLTTTLICDRVVSDCNNKAQEELDTANQG
jgi:hypothetical protein